MEMFFAFIMFLPGLYPYADSVEIHAGAGKSDSIESSNPVGHVELIADFKYASIKFKHESSLRDTDEGFGENTVVIYKKWKIK